MMRIKIRTTIIVAASLFSIVILLSAFSMSGSRITIRDAFSISEFVFEQNVILPLTCRGENEKIVTLGYPKWKYCHTVFSDGGKSCTDGNQCKSSVCLLSFNDNEKIRQLANQLTPEDYPFPNDASLSGTCLGNMPQNIDEYVYTDCPTMSIHNGQIKKISFCPVY